MTLPWSWAEKREPPPAQSWFRVDVRSVYAADEATYPESATSFRTGWRTRS